MFSLSLYIGSAWHAVAFDLIVHYLLARYTLMQFTATASSWCACFSIQALSTAYGLISQVQELNKRSIAMRDAGDFGTGLHCSFLDLDQRIKTAEELSAPRNLLVLVGQHHEVITVETLFDELID